MHAVCLISWGFSVRRANPYGEYYNDGISLSPYEVLFVKVKEKVLQNEWSFSVQAKKYAHYIAEQVSMVNEHQSLFSLTHVDSYTYLKISPTCNPRHMPQAHGQQEVVSNEYRANPRKFHLQRLGYLLQRGPECFDHEYYLRKNPDLRCGLHT